jgi:energy-coupling factor transporter ATP-binding protein EcfA2
VTRLSDFIAVDRTKLRSINIERDLDEPAALDGYVLSVRAAEGIQRVTSSQGEQATRAWSVAGPYGSGKSAFAQLLAGLFAPKGSRVRQAAERVLRGVDPAALKQVRKFRRAVDAEENGMLRAVATGQREAAGATVLRALQNGAETYWSGRGGRPRVVRQLSDEAFAVSGGKSVDPRRVLELVDGILEIAPVLLVVDEFGKCLEFAAQESAGGDLFLLQQLAERLSGGSEARGLLLTLQHLAFEDYVGLASSAQRREWRKVQGRFEELPFVNSEALGWRVVTEALAPPKDASIRREAAGSLERALSRAYEADIALPEDLKTYAARSYPLHPLALWVLPTLASRFGQGERTLAHFLTGDSVGSLTHFLAHTEATSPYPLLGVAELFDFFVGGGGEGAGLGEEGARLREVQLRLEEATGLSPLEAKLAKTIAAFNLVSSSGSQRAGRDLIAAAVQYAPGAPTASAVSRALGVLEKRGIIVYRDFADEYRVWRGSDFDVAKAITAERSKLEHSLGLGALPVDEISRVHPLRPVVAARHSQQTETLRFFEQRYAARIGDEDELTARDRFDGLIVRVLGDVDSVPRTTREGRPLIVVRSPFAEEVRASALDAAACLRTLNEATELESDPVARAEVRHRTAQAQALLAERLQTAFDTGRSGVEWYADGMRVDVRGPNEIARLLSDLCDRHYPKTPVIPSEMLNRHELTSQGAKARRELIGAMFRSPAKERLEIDGFGPDRAMYDAVFAASGIHRERGGRLTFGKPSRRSGLNTAWNAIERFLDEADEAVRGLDELYEVLLAPPFGMKEGPIPLLLAAALQARSEDVLLYEEGTFQPRLGPEHLERLMKTPSRFGVKRLALEGARAGVLEGIRELLSSPGLPEARNSDALSVVRPLILFAQSLPEFTRQTSRISPQAQAVRSSLFATREPDELLFAALPKAVGYARLDARAAADDSTRDVTAALAAALRELEAAYPSMLDHVVSVFRDAFVAKGPPSALREDLRARSRHLLDAVIEPRMRSFLMMASDQELDEREWIEAMAMNVQGTPPQTWTDGDIERFEAETNERAQWFRRLELLHYEMAVKPRKGFDVRRLTVTAPNGEETTELAWIDQEALPALRAIADDVLETVGRELGARSAEALIAVLADRVLTDAEERTPEAKGPRLDQAA